MKFYIASRVKNKELVQEIHNKLENLGYEVTSTWVKESNIIPYDKNPKAARERAAQCIKGVDASDIFILITDIEGAGMYTELGAAIHANLLNNKPKIYVIGEHLNRSMFFFYPGIKRFESFKEVLKDLK